MHVFYLVCIAYNLHPYTIMHTLCIASNLSCMYYIHCALHKTFHVFTTYTMYYIQPFIHAQHIMCTAPFQAFATYMYYALHISFCAFTTYTVHCIWVRSRNCGSLVTWFCYQLIAKPGNKTAAVSWPDQYRLNTVHTVPAWRVKYSINLVCDYFCISHTSLAH